MENYSEDFNFITLQNYTILKPQIRSLRKGVTTRLAILRCKYISLLPVMKRTPGRAAKRPCLCTYYSIIQRHSQLNYAKIFINYQLINYRSIAKVNSSVIIYKPEFKLAN